MMEELKMAWRNLWRNRRRTFITSASVFFAVFFAVILRSYQLGSYDHMISGFIESFTGHIQVQHKEFQDNPLIDNSFSYDDAFSDSIAQIDDVVAVIPHIETFLLASNGLQTKGVALIAIDPERERSYSDPVKKLVRYRITESTLENLKKGGNVRMAVMQKVSQVVGRSYASPTKMRMELDFEDNDEKLFLQKILDLSEISNSYLEANDQGVLVSDRLAGFLKTEIGDSVILMGQGYHGVSATGLFPVRGIIKLPHPDIDKRLIIMTLSSAQEFFDLDGKITSLVINLSNRSDKRVRNAQAAINDILSDTETTAKTWAQLNPVLHQQIQGDNQSGMVMLFLLYFIIFFGIFGTVLMMVSERKREFGILISIGMQKRKLKRIIILEMTMLGMMGLITGLLASLPIIIYFHYFPIILKGEMASLMEDWGWEAIMPTASLGPYLYSQAVIVAIMIILATIYPLRKIDGLKEMEALRS